MNTHTGGRKWNRAHTVCACAWLALCIFSWILQIQMIATNPWQTVAAYAVCSVVSLCESAHLVQVALLWRLPHWLRAGITDTRIVAFFGTRLWSSPTLPNAQAYRRRGRCKIWVTVDTDWNRPKMKNWEKHQNTLCDQRVLRGSRDF